MAEYLHCNFWLVTRTIAHTPHRSNSDSQADVKMFPYIISRLFCIHSRTAHLAKKVGNKSKNLDILHVRFRFGHSMTKFMNSTCHACI
jgi:hypothetical protein